MEVGFPSFVELGSTLGVSATLIIFYLWLQVRDMKREIEYLKKTRDNMQDAMSRLCSDVAFIRGLLEKDEK